MFVRQDSLMYLYSVIAISSFIYLSTFGGQLAVDSFIAFMIIVGGIVLQFLGHIYSEDPHIDHKESVNILIYAGASLVVFLLLDAVVPNIPLREVPLLVSIG